MLFAGGSSSLDELNQTTNSNIPTQTSWYLKKLNLYTLISNAVFIKIYKFWFILYTLIYVLIWHLKAWIQRCIFERKDSSAKYYKNVLFSSLTFWLIEIVNCKHIIFWNLNGVYLIKKANNTINFYLFRTI